MMPSAPPAAYTHHAWMTWVLRLAGIYNLLWGTWSILFPTHFWSLMGMKPPEYLFLWQGLGMLIGLFGVGYWLAAANPARYWPIIFIGLLSKVSGVLGFLDAWLIQASLPAHFGLTTLVNDLLWWIPFSLILIHAYKVNELARRDRIHAQGLQRLSTGSDLTAALATARTHEGQSLLDLSIQRPQLVIFLRHLGCTFCRETLADVAAKRAQIHAQGVGIVLIHMSDDALARDTFARYGLRDDIARVSDPRKSLHQLFGLSRGSLTQLFGPRVALRGFVAAILDRHFMGALQGDGFQMPGAFLLHHGKVIRAFRHEDAADRPDYCELART